MQQLSFIIKGRLFVCSVPLPGGKYSCYTTVWFCCYQGCGYGGSGCFLLEAKAQPTKNYSFRFHLDGP